MEYYSATNKRKILPFVTTWKKLDGIMLSEISQTEKDKYYVISLAMESEKAELTDCQGLGGGGRGGVGQTMLTKF